MAKKPRIPDPGSVKQCPDCGRSIGGKGYYGPECQCDLPAYEAGGGAWGGELR